MRLFRGISVAEEAADDIVRRIREMGVTGEGTRRPQSVRRVVDPRSALGGDVRERIATAETMLPAICAADELGALHYACRHNLSAAERVPLIIEFEASVDGVCIDGNDLLHRLFSRHVRMEPARPVLEACFGAGMLDYAERSWASSDPIERIALCDLATWDRGSILAHHESRLVIQGNHGTLFRSAFKVVLPIPAEAIVSIRRVEAIPPPPRPDVTIGSLTEQRDGAGRAPPSSSGLSVHQ